MKFNLFRIKKLVHLSLNYSVSKAVFGNFRHKTARHRNKGGKKQNRWILRIGSQGRITTDTVSVVKVSIIFIIFIASHRPLLQWSL